jgi:hypothetical protein
MARREKCKEKNNQGQNQSQGGIVTDDKKPREFWINSTYHPNGNAEHDIQGFYIEGTDYLHVIEKSAYDKLAKENEELKKEKEITWAKWNHTELESETTSLRESLKEANIIINRLYKRHLYLPMLGECICDHHIRAAEFLAKTEGKKGVVK